jgi:predicted ABC-type ATPase
MAEKTGRSIPDLAYEAMHQAATLRADLVTHRQSFIMETVLSDAQGAKLDFLKAAQLEGFFLIFIHITLADVEISIARVAQRVLNGGHDVPDEKLLARFPRTQVNAAKALAMADAGFVFDNSDPQCPYRLVETWERGTVHTQTK